MVRLSFSFFPCSLPLITYILEIPCAISTGKVQKHQETSCESIRGWAPSRRVIWRSRFFWGGKLYSFCGHFRKSSGRSVASKLLSAGQMQMGRAKPIMQFWGRKTYNRVRPPKSLWRPPKVGLVWSVPISSKGMTGRGQSMGGEVS